MSFLREFQYPNISQRKAIDYNTSLTFILIGLLFADIFLVLKFYFFYFPVIKMMLICGLIGLFTGNLLGKFLYTRVAKYRTVYVVSDALFIFISLLYFVRGYIVPGNDESIIDIFFVFEYSIPIFIFITALIIGIKINYFLKISCGDFIDNKQGISKFIGFSLLGIAAGTLLAGTKFIFSYPMIFFVIVPVLIIPSIFIINLPYSPSTIYAKDYGEEKTDVKYESKKNDTLIFTYLNFSYIIIYVFLGYLSIAKYYGDIFYIKLAFLIIILFCMLTGYIAGRFIKYANWHIYSESIFPLAFIVFLVLLISFHKQLFFIFGIIYFIPMAVLLGFTLNHTLISILNYDIEKRFSIIEFSALILPVPIIISLALVKFTHFWYFFLLSIIILTNIILPAIYIVNKNINGFKKALYFCLSLIFLPIFIFTVFYFKIPLGNNLYVTSTSNFDELKNVNYNALYIKNRAAVLMKKHPVFIISDSAIRNYKRAMVPIAIYHPEEENILFIDGNQKFFRNPVIGFYKNSLCLDPLSDDNVDHNSLAITGKQKYVSVEKDLLFYFAESDKKFFTIVDIPNLLDQGLNNFRFTEEYYRLIKKKLEYGGMFIQVFNLPECSQKMFSFAAKNIQKSFKHQSIYYFSNIMVILSSDNESIFAMKNQNFDRLAQFLKGDEDLANIYLSEVHVLSHLIGTDVDELIPASSPSGNRPTIFNVNSTAASLTWKGLKGYLEVNKKILEMIPRTPEESSLYANLQNLYANNEQILTLLKEAELAESEDRYEDETRYLFELKKYAEYRMFVQEYIFSILKYKEDYYLAVAMNREKNQRWEEAKKLYHAILYINKNNFDANYRLGLLYITLQDIENSFAYLQQAMNLNKEHPKVLYQMGVLFFSSGKIDEAIDYFNRAIQQNERGPAVYRYLGLSYEKMGNLYEAEKNYSKAVLADPNDADTKYRLDNIRMEIEKEKRKWDMPEQKNQYEDEQDSDMPLPISKSAYEVRLKDDDKSLPVLGPDGEIVDPGNSEKK